MAMRFILAIATDRKAALVRERCEQCDGVTILRSRHFGSILFREPGPLRWSFGIQPQFHRRHARCQVREPNVVPILGRELAFRHTSWRTANGSDSKSFALDS